MCYRLRELYTSLLGGAQSPVKNEGHAWVTRCVSLQEMQYCGKTGTSRTVKKLSELFTQMAAAKPDKERGGGGGRRAGETKRCWGMGWGRALRRQLLLFLNFFTTEPTAQRTLQLFFLNIFFKLKYS